MEDEVKGSLVTNSDDEVSLNVNKSVRKSAVVFSSEDEAETVDTKSKVEETHEKADSDSGVDDDSFTGNRQEDRKFKRVHRYESSDSEDDGLIRASDNNALENDKFSSQDKNSLSSQDVGTEHVSPNRHNNLISTLRDDIYDAEGSSEEDVRTEKSQEFLGETNAVSPSSKKASNFNNDIYDAEGSSEEDIRTEKNLEFQGEISAVSHPLKKKSKSKHSSNRQPNVKKSKDSTSEIDEIHKETQRMVRESKVSLPYHVPRQRSLQDFLNRRKSVPKIPLKSTSKDLSIVWKHIEERGKTAESFYNSETDGSDQEVEKTTSKSDEAVSINDEGTGANDSGLSKTIDSVELKESKISSESCNNEKITNSIDVPSTSFELEFDSVSGSCTNETSFPCDNGQLNSEQSSLSKSKENCEIFPKENVEDLPDQKNESIKDSDSTDHKVVKKDKPISASEDKKTNNSKTEYTFFDVPLEDDIENNKEDEELKRKSENSTYSVNGLDEGPSNNQFSSENLTKSLFETLDNNSSISNTNNENENSEENHAGNQTSGKTVSSNSISFVCDSVMLDKIPKLSCGPGDEIDLDQPIGGANHLLKRFMKHANLKTTLPKEKKPVKLSVLSVESNTSGEVKALTEEELIVSRQETKPGQKLSALKQSLRKSIEVSRSQLLAKRIEQYKLYEQEFYESTGQDPKLLDEEDDEFEMFSDKNDAVGKVDEKGSDQEESEVDDEEDELIEEDLKEIPKKKKSDFLDDEAEVSEDELESDSEFADDRLSDSYSVSQDSPAKINKVKKVLDFENDENSQASPLKKLDLSSLGLDKEDEEDGDLLGLCSGKFQTQPVSLTQLEVDSSQGYNPSTPAIESSENQFSQEMFSQRSIRPVKIIDSDEEEIENSQLVKSLITKHLQFSDDEDEVTSDHQNDDNSDKEETNDDNIRGESIADPDAEQSNQDAEEDDETSDKESHNENNDDKETKVIYYDSEEEIVEGRKFLEVEAELSGSECGSEDEDERGLSDFEADEADLEKINQSKLRTELERIHMQELMAEDKREIRLLQELLLEDGELHSDGPKRQRLYRWSNQDDAENFHGKGTLSDDESGAVDEEEEDFQWRKERLEREQFLNLTRKDEDVETLDENVNMPISDKKVLKSHVTPKLQTNLLTSPDPKQPFKLLTNRGSFLGRSEKVLSKLAGLSTVHDQQQQRVKRNMVFSVVSPPKHQEAVIQEPEKRKADEALPRIAKKLKFNQSTTKATRSLGLLQKLRESDQAT